MKRRWAIVGMVVALVVGAVAGGGIVKMMHKHEVMVTLDQVPAAVKATLQREAEAAAITDIEKVTCHRKTVYEAATTIGNNKYEMKVAEDGTLLVKAMKHGKHRG